VRRDARSEGKSECDECFHGNCREMFG
jgi:hypothetical protein